MEENKYPELAKTVKLLIGYRTLKQASEDTGVTSAYLSGILKGKFRPSVEVLKKLTDQKAKPENGVTLDLLLDVGGYKIVELDEFPDATTQRLLHYSYQMNNNDKVKKQQIGIIYKAIAECGMSFIPVQEEDENIAEYNPDIDILITQSLPVEWVIRCFPVCNQSFDTVKTALGKLVFVSPKAERKISLVIEKKEFFEQLLCYKHKFSYVGDVSIILVDLENFSIVDEQYLSHYNPEHKDSEFRIVQ